MKLRTILAPAAGISAVLWATTWPLYLHARTQDGRFAVPGAAGLAAALVVHLLFRLLARKPKRAGYAAYSRTTTRR